MLLDLNKYSITDIRKNYIELKIGQYECFYNGFIYSKNKMMGKETIEYMISELIDSGKITYGNYYGTYHIIIIDYNKKYGICFTDNAGCNCFYYNKEKNVLSDSFLELTTVSKPLEPNCEAITEFLLFNCVYSNSTICNKINRLESNEFIRINNNIMYIENKMLSSFNEVSSYKDMHSFLADTAYSIGDEMQYNIVTGGADSRTILSHFVNLNRDISLVISGNESMQDVIIAKEIANKLNLDLKISDEDIEESESYLKELFIASDGVYGIFSRNRLYRMSIMLKDLNAKVVFGGVAGELYKNSFLNQDFPFLKIGRLNFKKFYRMKVLPKNIDNSYFTDKIKNISVNMEKIISERLFHYEDNFEKSKVYFNIGHYLLQHSAITLGNSSSFYYNSSSPLFERDMLKLCYNVNPWKLELNKFQRSEISKYCYDIANIKTDRGNSLNNSMLVICKEMINSYLYLLKVAYKRTFRRNNKVGICNLPKIYKFGKNTGLFLKAIEKCKKLGIINDTLNGKDLPDELADKLMTIGMLFEEVQDEYYKHEAWN